MTKVVVMTDGWMDQDTGEALIDLAHSGYAANVDSKKNGVVAKFDDEMDAENYREAVMEDARFKGKLSNLYIGAA